MHFFYGKSVGVPFNILGSVVKVGIPSEGKTLSLIVLIPL